LSLMFPSASGLLVKRDVPCEELKFPRQKINCAPLDSQFLLKQNNFENQYFSVYCQRLNVLRTKVADTAKRLWINNVADPPLLLQKSIDIKPAQSVVLIGTLVKELKLLPTIIEQYTKERAIVPVPKDKKFVNEKDKVWLEDDSSRIQIKPGPYNAETPASWSDLDFDIHKYSHGSVMGVKGIEFEGVVYVEEFCVAGAPPQPDGPSLPNSEDPISADKGRYVVIMSGIAGAEPLQLQMMLNYIQGHLGSEKEQSEVISQIVRVIVAGNSFPEQQKKAGKGILRKQLKDRQHESEEKREYINLLRDLDIDLAHLASSIDVDVMPGESDPSNFTLPHQPLNSCLFPLSSKFSTFHRVSAPHMCTADQTVILGTSGEEIKNLQQFITVEDPTEIVEQLIGLRHIAPTAPNTLPAYPSEEEDPFVLNVCPHIYFVANQKSFSSKLFIGDNGQHTRIVSVPEFVSSNTIAFVNIDTLSCFPMNFSTDF